MKDEGVGSRQLMAGKLTERLVGDMKVDEPRQAPKVVGVS